MDQPSYNKEQEYYEDDDHYKYQPSLAATRSTHKDSYAEEYYDQDDGHWMDHLDF